MEKKKCFTKIQWFFLKFKSSTQYFYLHMDPYFLGYSWSNCCFLSSAYFLTEKCSFILKTDYFISSYYILLTGISYVAWQIISLSSHVKINPGPQSNVSNRFFSVCLRNLNNISTHKFPKVGPISACISVHQFNIILLLLITKSHLMAKFWKYQAASLP